MLLEAHHLPLLLLLHLDLLPLAQVLPPKPVPSPLSALAMEPSSHLELLLDLLPPLNLMLLPNLDQLLPNLDQLLLNPLQQDLPNLPLSNNSLLNPSLPNPDLLVNLSVSPSLSLATPHSDLNPLPSPQPLPLKLLVNQLLPHLLPGPLLKPPQLPHQHPHPDPPQQLHPGQSLPQLCLDQSPPQVLFAQSLLRCNLVSNQSNNLQCHHLNPKLAPLLPNKAVPSPHSLADLPLNSTTELLNSNPDHPQLSLVNPNHNNNVLSNWAFLPNSRVNPNRVDSNLSTVLLLANLKDALSNAPRHSQSLTPLPS